MQKYGKDWKAISNQLESKTEAQVSKHYQSIKEVLGLSVGSGDSDDDDSEEKKKKKQPKTSNEEPKLPLDNDLRFFAEIAAIKGSIDTNSSSSMEIEKEDQTYTATTLVHSWIARKYLSGIVPTDMRPFGLEVLAQQSEIQQVAESSIPDDIRPYLSRVSTNSNAHQSSFLDNDGLGYFWGDGLVSGEDGADDVNVSIISH